MLYAAAHEPEGFPEFNPLAAFDRNNSEPLQQFQAGLLPPAYRVPLHEMLHSRVLKAKISLTLVSHPEV